MPSPLPSDFGQLGQWLVMPATLTLLANLIITWFAAKATPQEQNVIKFVTFIVIGFVSYGLSKLSPDFVLSIEPLWIILAGVIGAYYGTSAIKQVWVGLQFAGLRLVLGQADFALYHAEREKRIVAKQLIPVG